MATLAIHPGALGDVILLGHLLARVEHPITLVAGGAKGRLLQEAGIVQRVLDFDGLPMHELFSDVPPRQCRLASLLGGHERLISCFGGQQPHRDKLAAICGAQLAAFLPVRPAEDFRGHLLDLWADILGVKPVLNASDWRVPQGWSQAASAVLRRLGVHGRYAILHVGASGPSKRWPVDRFLALGKLLAYLGVQPVFCVGPVEHEKLSADEKASLAGEAALDCPPLDVLAGAAAGACCFVGNDSGPVHLSAATGAATVAIFGPTTSREHFQPVGPTVECLFAPSLPALSEEDVFHAARRLMGRHAGGDR